jgi:xanthine dehydrogenase small subunit
MGAFRFKVVGDEISLARVAFGGMAATPVRALEIEKNLIGQRITDELIKKVESHILEELEPISDVRASSSYRLEIAQAMLRRALQELSGQERLVITEL